MHETRKKIRDFINNMSFIWKVTLIYYLIVFFLFSIGGTYFIARTHSNYIEKYDELLSQNIIKSRDRIQDGMLSCKSISDSLVFQNELISLLENNFLFQADEILYIKLELKNTLNNYIHFYPGSSILIYSVNNEIPKVNGLMYHMEDFTDQEAQEMLISQTGFSVWGKIKESGNNGSLGKLPLYTRITAVGSKKTVGILEIAIELDSLLEHSKADDSEDIVMLLNTEGDFVYGDYNTEVLKAINQEEDMTFDRAFLADGKYRVMLKHVPETDLVVAAAFPYFEIKQGLRWSIFGVVILLMTSGAALFILIFVITKLLMKRYNKLSQAMEQVSNGELGILIEENRRDEIGLVIQNFNLMSSKLLEATELIIEKENAKKSAELNALQSQINPHFLYNTLECLKAVSNLEKQYLIAEGLTSLGKIFRYNTNWKNIYVSLSEELDYVKNYLQLLLLRYKDKVEIAYVIEPHFMQQKVIKMILQPVLENAFTHGIRDNGFLLHIKIGIEARENSVCIWIYDDGKGIGAEQVENMNRQFASNRGIEDVRAKKKSVGLLNVDSRIKIICGNEYGLSIESEIGLETRVLILLPDIF